MSKTQDNQLYEKTLSTFSISITILNLLI